MSNAMKTLEDILAADAAKAEKFQEVLKGANEAGAKNDVEGIHLAAAAIGVDIPQEQIEQSLACSRELDIDDLELVTGGTNYASCWVAHACLAAFMHDGDKNESCLKDYFCEMFAAHSPYKPQFEE